MKEKAVVRMDAHGALERLKAGNHSYREASLNEGDISRAARAATSQEGQHPYAIVIACSDSRVVPEHIFMAGIGELFTIRVAGNVVGPLEAASVAYAATHVQVPLVLVLGHTRCGAVEAALSGGAQGCMVPLTDAIIKAIGDEHDDHAASRLNVLSQIRRLLAVDEIAELVDGGSLAVAGALYRVEDGEVEFFQ